MIHIHVYGCVSRWMSSTVGRWVWVDDTQVDVYGWMCIKIHMNVHVHR